MNNFVKFSYSFHTKYFPKIRWYFHVLFAWIWVVQFKQKISFWEKYFVKNLIFSLNFCQFWWSFYKSFILVLSQELRTHFLLTFFQTNVVFETVLDEMVHFGYFFDGNSNFYKYDFLSFYTNVIHPRVDILCLTTLDNLSFGISTILFDREYKQSN